MKGWIDVLCTAKPLTSPAVCHIPQCSRCPSWVQSYTVLQGSWSIGVVLHYVGGCPTEECHEHMSMPRTHTPVHCSSVGFPPIGVPAPAHISANINIYSNCNPPVWNAHFKFCTTMHLTVDCTLLEQVFVSFYYSLNVRSQTHCLKTGL